MVVCTYCRKERPFWAVDEDGTGDYSAHIVSGTNAFVDTAGKRMSFRFCPMCGRPLTNPPDDGGGKVLGLFAFTRPTYRNSIKKECITYGQSQK